MASSTGSGKSGPAGHQAGGVATGSDTAQAGHLLRGGLGRGALESASEVGPCSRRECAWIHRKALLLGREKAIGGVQEPGINDGTEWDPGEPEGWE